MNKFFYNIVLLSFALFSFTFVACSSDDDDDDENSKTDDPSEIPADAFKNVVDELGTLQASLVRIDSLGNFEERVLGESLDDADTTVVSVGVDSYEEARHIFGTLFADTTVIKNDSTVAEFTVDKGYAQLNAGDGKEGLVAYATFNVEGLKYVSQVNFILNSAWPHNASSVGYHKLGKMYRGNGWTDDVDNGYVSGGDHKLKKTDTYNYICIREYNNGQPALLVGFTELPVYLPWSGHDKWAGRMPDLTRTIEIAKILRSNWDFYVECSKIDGYYLLTTDYYWINGGESGYHTYMYTFSFDATRNSQNNYWKREVIYWGWLLNVYHSIYQRSTRYRACFYMLSGAKG